MDPLKTTAAPESRLHFLDYWRIIRIRKAVIISVFLLVSITATVVTYFLPKSYSSKAMIQVQRDAPDRPGLEGGGGMTGYDPFFIETEFRIIQSELVLDRVITNLNLNEEWTKKFNQSAMLTTVKTRGILRSMIDLRPVRNTPFIDITVYSPDKNEAAMLANEVARIYEEYRKDVRANLMKEAIAVFEGVTEELDLKIRKAETNVNDLRVEFQVSDSDPQSYGPAATLEPMVVLQLNATKIQAKNDAIRASTELTKLRELTNYTELRNTLPRLTPDPILSALLNQFLAAESALESAEKGGLGKEHPDYLKISAVKSELTRQLSEQVAATMTALQTKVESLDAQALAAQAQLDEAKTNDIMKAKLTRPYWMAKSDLDRLKRQREVMNMKTFTELVELKMPTTTVVKQVETALPGGQPVRPKKALNITVGLILGLVVGLGLAFFIEYLDTSVKTIDDVERTLQAPVLGVIPQDVGYLLDEGAESPHAEAYRVLRTNLLFSRKDDNLNTMAVVSAGAGEGKSTTVCNLATVFAQGGQRVLMVDSDLRRPTLHKILGVSNTVGLTNYLLKQNTLEEVIQTTKLPTLDLMPSGKLPSSSLGILNSAQMKDLISALKQRYDFVLFDSPPIMGVSDASILASEVDMTLQVIQYRRYPQPMNVRAKQLIEKVGGNLVGIVLNNINMAQDESYYYYSGYYHDYYSKNDDAGAGSNGSAKEKSRADIKPKA